MGKGKRDRALSSRGRRLSKAPRAWVLGSAVLATSLAGCVATLPVNRAIITPLEGQSRDATDQDKTQCFRLAQPGPGSSESVGSAPLVGGASGAAVGAAVGAGMSGGVGAARGALTGGMGGLVGGFLGAAVRAEVADAKARPPDLDKYSDCLRERGYEIRWPK